MARSTTHGGGCCGAKHINGFSGGDQAEADALTGLVAGNINGQALEIILNARQIAGYPLTLRKMAELGFVLDGHWQNGNHGLAELPVNPTDANLGSHCFRFTRMDRRKPLTEGAVVGAWNGMVMSAGLTGLLQQMSGGVPGNNRAHFTRPLDPNRQTVYQRGGGALAQHPYRPGDVVRVTNRNSRRFGREFTVVRVAGPAYDSDLSFRDDETNTDFRLMHGSVEMVRPGVDRQAPWRPAVGTRVQFLGERTYSGNFNNGEFATIIRVAWPSIEVRFDRAPTAPLLWPTQYFTAPEGDFLVPLITPPAAAGPVVQVHENAEALLGAMPLPLQPAAPVVVAPRVVFRTYHNVYRDGRFGAGYDTFTAARDARLPSTGRIDRREIYSDGTTRLIENITE